LKYNINCSHNIKKGYISQKIFYFIKKLKIGAIILTLTGAIPLSMWCVGTQLLRQLIFDDLSSDGKRDKIIVIDCKFQFNFDPFLPGTELESSIL